MFERATQTVTYLADIVDPTSDGILTRVMTFSIQSMMLLVVLMGGWYALKAWNASAGKGDASGSKSLRDIAFGVILIEAFLGGILYFANYGTSLLPSLGIG